MPLIRLHADGWAGTAALLMLPFLLPSCGAGQGWDYLIHPQARRPKRPHMLLDIGG